MYQSDLDPVTKARLQEKSPPFARFTDDRLGRWVRRLSQRLSRRPQ